MKIGDTVVVRDRSYVVKLDGFTGWSQTIDRDDEFKVLAIFEDPRIVHYTEKFSMHDIVIQSKTTGAIYLHSSPFVDVVEDICPCCKRPL